MKVLLLCLLSCLTVWTEAQQPFACNDQFFNYIQLINYADIKMLGYQSYLNRIETSITEMKHSLRRNAKMERLFYASKEYGGSYYLARRSWYERFGIGLMEANRDCEGFGGYLLEINKQSEYNYVASFLSSIPLKTHFFTGVFYSNNYPGWYFYNKGNRALYLSSLTQIRPTPEKLCLTISNHVNQTEYEVLDCRSEGSYICEIPESDLGDS